MAHHFKEKKNESGTGRGSSKEKPYGLERRLLATVRWTVATAVAFPQESESILAHHFKKEERDLGV